MILKKKKQEIETGFQLFDRLLSGGPLPPIGKFGFRISEDSERGKSNRIR